MSVASNQIHTMDACGMSTSR